MKKKLEIFVVSENLCGHLSQIFEFSNTPLIKTLRNPCNVCIQFEAVPYKCTLVYEHSVKS